VPRSRYGGKRLKERENWLEEPVTTKRRGRHQTARLVGPAGYARASIDPERKAVQLWGPPLPSKESNDSTGTGKTERMGLAES